MSERTGVSTNDLLAIACRTAQVGGWSLDVSSNQLKWTDEVFRIHHLEPGDQPTLEQSLQFYTDSSQTKLSHAIQTAIESGASWELELQLRTATQKQICVRVTGEAVFENGQCQHLVGAVQAVAGPVESNALPSRDANKSSQQRVVESQQQLDLALTSANVGLWDWDTSTNEVFFSDTYKTQLGYDASESWGSFDHWLKLLHPEDRELTTTHVGRYLDGNDEQYTATFRMRAADGSYKWIRAQGKANRNEQGEPTRVIGVHIDVTERIHEAKQLAAVNRALARSNKALQEFAYTVSHDLQSPLRTIAGFAGFLREDCESLLDDNGRDYVERILRGVDRMRGIITDLLAYSRVESQASPSIDTNVSDAINEAIQMLEASIADAKAIVQVEDMPNVVADPSQLSQVFLNLIGNAIKYRRADVPPEVRISCVRKDDAWRFEVADNGIGIEQRNCSAVFDLFRRLHTEQEYPGTGIGLAITRRIISRHRGEVGVESTLGTGSRFWFTLPVAD